MLAERERIEGIRQIEVAWSRVPGAESTGLHTAHPKPRSLSYSFALLPRRSPSFSRFLFSFPHSNSPSPSLPYALRSTVASSSLSPSSSLDGILASSSLSSDSLSLFLCSLLLLLFPQLQVLLPLSVPFAFSVLLRVASVLSRQPPLPTVVVVVDDVLDVVVVIVVAARPLPSLAYLVGLLTLSVNHPPCRTFPASPLLPSPPSSTALRHPPTCPPLVS